MIEIDDVRAVDADEHGGIETLLELAQRRVDAVPAACRVDIDEVIAGFQAFYRGRAERKDPSALANEETSHGRAAAQSFFRPLGRVHAGAALQCGSRALDRLQEPVAAERFEQVVDGGELERRHRVAVVRRSEDDRGHVLHAFQNLETRQARHSNVEKHQIRPVLINSPGGTEPVGRFTQTPNPGDLSQQLAHLAAGQRLVVDDERRDGQRFGNSSSVHSTGIFIVTA